MCVCVSLSASTLSIVHDEDPSWRRRVFFFSFLFSFFASDRRTRMIEMSFLAVGIPLVKRYRYTRPELSIRKPPSFFLVCLSFTERSRSFGQKVSIYSARTLDIDTLGPDLRYRYVSHHPLFSLFLFPLRRDRDPSAKRYRYTRPGP